jgi:hypothetical protein
MDGTSAYAFARKTDIFPIPRIFAIAGTVKTVSMSFFVGIKKPATD